MTDGVTGTWRLQSHTIVDTATGVRSEPFGARPSGLLILGEDGYMTVVITADPAVAAAMPLLAYAGRYRLETERLVTSVEVAWLAAWVGSEQVRGLHHDGDRLELTTPAPTPATTMPMVATLVWSRAA